MSAPSYRTSSLFHFTKKLDVLKSILRTGIVPNFCKEDLSYEDRKRIIGVPMNYKLKYKVDDISYIIVEKDDQISDMVDYILGLDSIGGNEELMPDNDKKLLLTKIISQEKIGKDF